MLITIQATARYRLTFNR